MKFPLKKGATFCRECQADALHFELIYLLLAWWIKNLSLMNFPLSLGTLLYSFIDSMPKIVIVMLPCVVHLVKKPEFELEPSLLGSYRQILLPGGLWKSLIWPGHSWVSSSSWVCVVWWWKVLMWVGSCQDVGSSVQDSTVCMCNSHIINGKAVQVRVWITRELTFIGIH